MAQLWTYPVSTITIPTPDVRCMCGDLMADFITHHGTFSDLVECNTGGLIHTAPPPERANSARQIMANATTSQASATQYFTEGCSFSTYPAGTIDGVVFATPEVRCQCGTNGTIMAGINTRVTNGTASIGCATGLPALTSGTSYPTASPLPTAATSSSPTISASQTSTTSAAALPEIAEAHSNTMDSANRTGGGGSPFDAQSGSVKAAVRLGGMLAAVLALAAAFTMG